MGHRLRPLVESAVPADRAGPLKPPEIFPMDVRAYVLRLAGLA